jgi:hypothetical protein
MGELACHPASCTHRHGHPDPRTSAAASQARVASEKAREAAQKAEQERIDTQYEHCFSPWNGSHKLLVDLVKAKINTPRSFKHVKTTAYLGDFPRPVVMQFDAQNVFGAMLRTTVKAVSGPDFGVGIP